MRLILLAAASAMLLVPTAGHAAQPLLLPPAVAAKTPADFARSVAIRNDGQGDVMLSTHPARRADGPVRGAWTDDAHLRAIVSRETGKVSWQVWHDLVYPRFKGDVSTVRYRLAGTPMQVRPAKVEHWFDHCPAGDTGQCRELTRVTFELPEEHVRKVAASWRAGSRETLQLRFVDGKGERVTAGVAPAEFAGLLHAYDEWRQGHKNALADTGSGGKLP